MEISNYRDWVTCYSFSTHSNWSLGKWQESTIFDGVFFEEDSGRSDIYFDRDLQIATLLEY